MIPIAVIADKLPSTLELLLWLGALSIPGMIFTLLARKAGCIFSAVITLGLIGVFLNDLFQWSYGNMWGIVWDELGPSWLVGYFVATWLPLMSSLVIYWFKRHEQYDQRGFEVEITRTNGN